MGFSGFLASQSFQRIRNDNMFFGRQASNLVLVYPFDWRDNGSRLDIMHKSVTVNFDLDNLQLFMSGNSPTKWGFSCVVSTGDRLVFGGSRQIAAGIDAGFHPLTISIHKIFGHLWP